MSNFEQRPGMYRSYGEMARKLGPALVGGALLLLGLYAAFC